MIYKLGDKTPKIGDENFIAENSTIIGDVVTGKNVSIWYSAVLRGDCSNISIGDCSNIQDNVTVHGDFPFPVKIGKGVTVGHNCVI
ncbi:MAG: gamma carbonic anhydrase family protein, partial [Fusobacteriaceae bacterium]